MLDGTQQGIEDSVKKEEASNTAIFKMDNQQDLLYSTGNYALCYVAARMGEEFGGEWIPVSARLRSFPVHLKLSQICLYAHQVSLGGQTRNW